MATIGGRYSSFKKPAEMITDQVAKTGVTHMGTISSSNALSTYARTANASRARAVAAR